MIKRIFYLLLPVCLTAASLGAANPTTRGKVFWVAFLENLPLQSNGQPSFSFYVSCEVNTTGVIEIPATGYSQSFSAAAGQVTEIFLPQAIFYPIGSESVTNFGLRVTAADSITLSVQHHRYFYSEATGVLPVSELASEYMVVTHDDDFGIAPGLPEFTVVATEDNTTVDITPTGFTLGFRPPGIPFSVTLNKGQTYQVQTYSDLTGSSIQAREGKPIAVFAGATYGNIQCQATNHFYEQLSPLNQWGVEYFVKPFVSVGAPTEFRIVASQNGTQVFINCNPPFVLNKGEFHTYTSTVPARISATAPIGVGQFRQGQECGSIGDPAFLMLKPIGFVSHKSVFESMQSVFQVAPFANHYVNIIVRTATASFVTLDNNPVPFTPFAATPGYSHATIALTTGTHTLASDSGFYAYAYGAGSYDGYAYFVGYDAYQPPQAGPLTITHSDTLCSSETVAFNGSYPSGVTSWYWSFGDGSSSTAQNASHVYGTAGTYPVTLLVVDALTGCPAVAQQEVEIERCFYSEDCEVYVPGGFSPNGDDVNDVACVYGACITAMEFTIYDRWGEVMFRTTDQAACWDGTYHGQPLDHAVFAWTLNATLLSGTELAKSGNITLVR
jgi:gliding motility-associated-like protein